MHSSGATDRLGARTARVGEGGRSVSEDRVRVEGTENLGPCQAFALPLRRGARGVPRQAIVLRDESGTLQAYLNVCMHTPIPIDAGGGDFLSKDGKSLLCRTHGALYRLDDGYCFQGPCKGKSLVRLPLRLEADGIYLEDVE